MVNRVDAMVREEGIEPSNPYGYRILSPVRLPISPLPHSMAGRVEVRIKGKRMEQQHSLPGALAST